MVPTRAKMELSILSGVVLQKILLIFKESFRRWVVCTFAMATTAVMGQCEFKR